MIEGTDAADVRYVMGQRLKEARLNANMSQRGAADMSGMTQASLSNYEAGLRDIPLVSTLLLCRTYGADPAILLPDLPDA